MSLTLVAVLHRLLSVQEATVTAADLANQKQLLSQLQGSVTTEFDLACVKLGSQSAAGSSSVSEVMDHIEALSVIQVPLRVPQTG